MRRFLMILLVLAGGLPAGIPQAQPGGAPGQPGAEGGSAVNLAYKFKAGAVTRLRLQMKGELQIPLGADPAAGLPLTISADALTTQKVTAVSPQGEGTVTTTVTSGKMSYDAVGYAIVIKSVNGKLSVTQNGQPIAPGQLGGQAEAIVPAPLNGKPLTMRLSPRGAILAMSEAGSTPIAGPDVNPGAVFSGAFSLLPDHPVRPGESWEEKSAEGGAGGVSAVQSRGTLKSLATRNGHQIATIVTTGSMGPAAGTRTFTVTTQFDVTDGQPVSTNLEVTLSAAPAGPGAPAAGGPAGAAAGGPNPATLALQATGKITMSSTVLAPSPPKPPARKR
jgi:hypothetical protein